MFLLDLSLQARATKAKPNRWDYIKIKGFCTVKETNNKLRKNGRRYLQMIFLFAIFKIDKELLQLNIKHLIKKVDRGPEQTFVSRRHTDS